MKFSISRDDILSPLQVISGVVERKQTMPVLSNILVVAEQGVVSLTGTNMEVELVCKLPEASIVSEGRTTIPARKLSDICRSLPADAVVELSLEGDKAHLHAGKSHFTLATLPADQFPNTDENEQDVEVRFSEGAFKSMLESTAFAMAQQDVRYYLNGMLLEIGNQYVKTVATDGHRLALSSVDTDQVLADKLQVIVPRKGVQEFSRLLSDSDDEVAILIGDNHIQSEIGNYRFTSKLIDGKFPEYERVIPQGGDKVIVAERESLKAMFTRASILSHENIRGIQLQLSPGQVQVFANNPEHEQAEDSLDIIYDGQELQIAFNVGYLIDVLSTIKTDSVKMTLSNASSSALIESGDEDGCLYVVMPMRL
jgi:DNA polymerase-3 subunit beta